MKLAASVLTVFAACALPAGAMAADEPPKIYQCTDDQGNIVYQDEPCIEAAPPKPAAPNAAKPKAAPKSKAKPAAKPVAKPMTFVVPPQSPPESFKESPTFDRAADPRLLTPEKTLKTFVAAIQAGDRPLIISCLTDSALADWGPGEEELPLDKLRETVSTFTGYVSEGNLGPYWSMRALRAGTRPKWIFFERTWDGAWRIGAF